MTDTLSLQAHNRTQHGRIQSSRLRKEGKVPAVLYGHDIPTQSLSVDGHAIEKLFRSAGESTLIDLQIENENPTKVLIHGIQKDPLGTAISHVDFYQVNMKEKIHAEIELVFEGIAPAVKELGGTLVKNMTHVQIECLPSDLLHSISIDITPLKTFDDSIRVQDLPIPTGVTILDDVESTIVLVMAPRSAEELEALEETIVEDVASVEVTTEKKETEEKAAE